jgi:alpha-tubulin suppressor-like RCC1 family protein
LPFAVGEDEELFSWDNGIYGLLGHGDTQNQPSPTRVEAMRGVRVSSVSVGVGHVLALAEDGLVYAWGKIARRTTLGNPNVERELLPTPFEALRGVRVSSIAAGSWRSYAVADTGEVWAWGHDGSVPLGHCERMDCPLPKPLEVSRGLKVDAVAADEFHTLALADDGSVYVWGDCNAARRGALGLGPSVRDECDTGQRRSAFRRCV